MLWKKWNDLHYMIRGAAGLLLLATLATGNPAQPPQELAILVVNQPVERELAGGQSHSYQLALTAGQYLHVVTEQRGIDVVVVLVAPDGKKQIEVDSPNEPYGLEPLMWITENGGTYRLEIRSLDKEAKAGRYEVKIMELRAATEADRALIEALSLSNKSVSLYGKGKFAEAIPLAERALILREKTLGPNHLDVAESLKNLAAFYYYNGDYAKAEPLSQRALAIREKALGPNHPNAAESLSDLAVLYDKKGDYMKAERFHQRALAIWEQTLGPHHPDLAIALNNLAEVYRKKGDYAQAERLFQRALAIWEQALGPHHPNVATVLNNLAVLYREKGDYAKAEPLLQRALEIKEKALGPNHPGVATSLNNLARLYDDKGEYAKAELLYQQVLAIREKTLSPNHLSVAYLLNNLAVLYVKKGDYAKAEPLLQRALEIKEKALGPNHPDVAYSLNDLAVLYREKGEYAKAEPLLQRALSINEQALGPNHPDVAQSLNNLAVLYRDQENTQQGLAFAARATEVSEFTLNQTLIIGSERQKLLFLALRESETNFTLSLHAQFAPNDPQALKLALTTLLRRKGRGLEAASDAIAALRRRANPAEQARLDQLIGTRSQLATLTLRGPGNANPDQFRTQLKQLAEEADNLEAELSARNVEFRVQTQPVTIAAIQAALPTDAALVEFATYRSYDTKTRKDGPLHYVAYTLAAQGPPRWVELGEAAPIDRAVAALRQALRNQKRTEVKLLARAVDKQVMQPVRSLLGQTRRVLISPDGALNLVPFAALVDAQGRYLVERYSFSYLTSGRDLLRLQVHGESQSAPLVLANPNFDAAPLSAAKPAPEAEVRGVDLSTAHFTPLPGTAAEAQALQALLPKATVLTGSLATEAALKQVVAPSLLHIATHGFFLADVANEPTDDKQRLLLQQANAGQIPSGVRLENPLLRSGLGLAGVNQRQSGPNDDGILTALEVSGLNLWGTKLVVLSACDTGVGEIKNGDGVYGLRRALVLAGSETQVMSLWPISDVGTRDLMIAYYKRLQAGEGRSEGLRQVQLEMLRNPQRRHPYYWATFIQSGEWANLAGKR